jgi:hypothetical protein
MNIFRKQLKKLNFNQARLLSKLNPSTRAPHQPTNLNLQKFPQKIQRKFSNFSEPLCPLDGRYKTKVESLAPYFSEKAFNGYRIQVEIEWLKFLIKERIVEFDKKLDQLGEEAIISKKSKG